MRTFLLPLFISLFICSGFSGFSSENLASSVLFVKNDGQVERNIPFAPSEVAYYAHFNAMSIFLQESAIVYQRMDGKFHSEKEVQSTRITMRLLGANPASQILPSEKTAITEKYFSREAGAIVESSTFKRITFTNVYPNIDWVIYSNENGLKYDFIVHPGGDPSIISFTYENAHTIRIDEDGALLIHNANTAIREKAPVSFNADKIISTAFQKEGNIISFYLENYDASKTLTIDPDVVWSSYIGANGFDEVRHSVVDESGNIYLTGMTSASSGIAVDGFQMNYGGGNYDAFIAKLNKDGVLIWATYFGGAQSDFGNALALDEHGNIFLVGSTSSNAAIASNGADLNYGGGIYDGFILKLSAQGALQWASYIGGNAEDTSWSVDIDELGNAIVLSNTASNDAIANSIGQASNAGGVDLMIHKYNTDGELMWARYYGGAANEETGNIVYGMDGAYYVSASTASANFALNGGQTTYGGGASDGLIAKFNTEGMLMWSSYIGGSGDDYAHALSINNFNQLFISGSTSSTNGIATAGAAQTSNGGGTFDAFIGRYALNGQKLWMSYFGGEGIDRGFGCAVDELGSVYVGGITSSIANITFNPFQQDNGGGTDLFFAFYDSLGVKSWSSYLGGSGDEFLRSISADENSKIIFSGNSASTAGALNGWDTSYGGGTDGFYGKVQDCDNPYVTVDALGETMFCFGESVGLSVGGADNFLWSTEEITTVISVDTTQVVFAIGTIESTGCRAMSNLLFVEALYTPTVTAYAEGPTEFCEFGEVTLHAQTEDEYEYFEWNTSEQGATITVFESGNYSVGAVADNGCIGQSDPITITITPAPQVAAAIATDVTCISTPTVNLVGVPFGGEFIGNGVMGSTFIPEMAGGGFHEVQYQWMDMESGCIGYSEVMTIEVLFEEIQLFVDQTEFCVFDAPMDLFGFPEGGFFTGPGVSEFTFFPELAGPGIHEIAYIYYDENGCANSSEQMMTVDACTNVVEHNNGITFSIWPNPTSEFLFIQTSIENSLNVRITDISGKELLQHSNIQINQPVSVSSLAPGIYIIMLENEGTVFQKKFIKQ